MPIAFEHIALKKFGLPFVKKVNEVSKSIGINPDWLMQVMANESGLSPSKMNPQTKAVGLIQFMPFIAEKVLHTTTDTLRRLPATEQLNYVEKFYKQPQFKGKLKSLETLYLAAFYPYALNQPDNFIIGSEKGPATARKIARQNKGFDYNGDGWVTVEDYKDYIKHNLKPERHILAGIGEITKYSVGDKIYARDREFTIVDISPIGPNTKRARPEIAYNFIARGKRGAYIMGWIMEDGSSIITIGGLSGAYDHTNDPFSIYGTYKYEGRGDMPYYPELDPRKPSYRLKDNYDFLFTPDNNKTTFEADAGLDKTIETIKKAAKTGKEHVKKSAEYLKAGTLEQSAYNVWHFLKTNVKYHLDKPGTEQIRTPNRSWKDRNNGIDCEDFAIFAHALLTDMGYHPSFDIVGFNHKKEFGHIYTTVKDSTGSYVVDVVVGEFNQTAPNITKTMLIETLSGIPQVAMVSGFAGITPADAFTEQVLKHEAKLQKGVSGLSRSETDKQIRKLRYLRILNNTEERNTVAAMMPYVDDISPKGNFIMKRHADLQGMVERIEALEGLSGRKERKERRAKRKAEGKGIFRKAFKFIKKFSPLTVAIRNSFLLGMRINFLHLSKRIKYGYMTPEQARAANLDMNEYEKLRGVIQKMTKLWEKIGGNPEKLRNAIIKGGKGLSGIETLNAITALHPSPLDMAGLGFAPVAAVTAAIPLLTAVAKLASAVNFPKLLKKKKKKGDEESTTEAAGDQTAADYESRAQNRAVTDMSEVLPEDPSENDGSASIQDFTPKAVRNKMQRSPSNENEPDEESTGDEESQSGDESGNNDNELSRLSEEQANDNSETPEENEMSGIGAFLDSVNSFNTGFDNIFPKAKEAYNTLRPVLSRRPERNPVKKKAAKKITEKKNTLATGVQQTGNKAMPLLQPGNEIPEAMPTMDMDMQARAPESHNDNTALLIGGGVVAVLIIGSLSKKK